MAVMLEIYYSLIVSTTSHYYPLKQSKIVEKKENRIVHMLDAIVGKRFVMASMSGKHVIDSLHIHFGGN